MPHLKFKPSWSWKGHVLQSCFWKRPWIYMDSTPNFRLCANCHKLQGARLIWVCTRLLDCSLSTEEAAWFGNVPANRRLSKVSEGPNKILCSPSCWRKTPWWNVYRLVVIEQNSTFSKLLVFLNHLTTKLQRHLFSALISVVPKDVRQLRLEARWAGQYGQGLQKQRKHTEFDVPSHACRNQICHATVWYCVVVARLWEVSGISLTTMGLDLD